MLQLITYSAPFTFLLLLLIAIPTFYLHQSGSSSSSRNRNTIVVQAFSFPFGRQKKIGIVRKGSISFLESPAAICFETNHETITQTTTTAGEQKIRYLGKGNNAIIRPGVVLLAPKILHRNYQHHRRAAIFIYDMGINEDGEYLTRGVILDNPTPCTIGEVADSTSVLNQRQGDRLHNNRVFRRREHGSNDDATAILFHNQPHTIAGDGSNMIGTSGIYQGGLQSTCSNNIFDNQQRYYQENFKFFFHYCEFTDIELEKMLAENVNDSNGDAWISAEVPTRLILADWSRGRAWKKLRKATESYWKQ